MVILHHDIRIDLFIQQTHEQKITKPHTHIHKIILHVIKSLSIAILSPFSNIIYKKMKIIIKSNT